VPVAQNNQVLSVAFFINITATAARKLLPMPEQLTPAMLNAWRLEFADSATESLEDIAGTHFLFKEDCPPETRSWIRQRQALAREVLETRQTQESGQVPRQQGIQ